MQDPPPNPREFAVDEAISIENRDTVTSFGESQPSKGPPPAPKPGTSAADSQPAKRPSTPLIAGPSSTQSKPAKRPSTGPAAGPSAKRSATPTVTKAG